MGPQEWIHPLSLREERNEKRIKEIRPPWSSGLRRGTKGSRCEEGSLKELFKQSWYPSMRSAECSACPIGERKEVESREWIPIARPLEPRVSFGSDAALARAKEYRITVEDRLHSDTNERQSRSPKRPRRVTIRRLAKISCSRSKRTIVH